MPIDLNADLGEGASADAELMALGADATCDIASTVGHELPPALMAQAIHRLQTCVPLRFWRQA